MLDLVAQFLSKFGIKSDFVVEPIIRAVAPTRRGTLAIGLRLQPFDGAGEAALREVRFRGISREQHRHAILSSLCASAQCHSS
jgi:hypothetical protein